MSIVHVPFYPSDWLAGTAVLSDTEKGVYITLVSRMYEMAGPIERDDNRLFRLCGSKSKASFVKSLEYLISEGKILVTDEGLFNEKVSKVIEQTTEKSTKAKAAAQSRWDRKSNKNKGGHDADAPPEHMHEPCQPEPEPEPIKTHPYGCDADGVPGDVVLDIWEIGSQALSGIGLSDRGIRECIGMWISRHGHTSSLNAIVTAQRAGTKDPIPYIQKVLNPSGGDLDEIFNKLSEGS